MTEHNEVKASHEEVEAFVGKLREFRGSLAESEQAMLDTVFESAQGDTSGYPEQEHEERPDVQREGGRGWNDLLGWIEEQGEDTQGFAYRKF
jgi:hypothetical protein